MRVRIKTQKCVVIDQILHLMLLEHVLPLQPNKLE